jgi:hypothetical protein
VGASFPAWAAVPLGLSELVKRAVPLVTTWLHILAGEVERAAEARREATRMRSTPSRKQRYPHDLDLEDQAAFYDLATWSIATAALQRAFLRPSVRYRVWLANPADNL